MEGDAVQSLTVMFLEMWNAIKKTDTDYAPYFPEITYTAKQTGYVQPYADNPLDDEHTGEIVYEYFEQCTGICVFHYTVSADQ